MAGKSFNKGSIASMNSVKYRDVYKDEREDYIGTPCSLI